MAEATRAVRLIGALLATGLAPSQLGVICLCARPQLEQSRVDTDLAPTHALASPATHAFASRPRLAPLPWRA
jgi:hypothetical protein